jgi:hypothetical protein
MNLAESPLDRRGLLRAGVATVALEIGNAGRSAAAVDGWIFVHYSRPIAPVGISHG